MPPAGTLLHPSSSEPAQISPRFRWQLNQRRNLSSCWKHCPNMHVMCMSGREEGVNSTHFGSAHVKNVMTQKRYSAKENHTKPVSSWIVNSMHCCMRFECMERAKLASPLVHPILKRGHSNAVEASHNTLIRFLSLVQIPPK